MSYLLEDARLKGVLGVERSSDCSLFLTKDFLAMQGSAKIRIKMAGTCCAASCMSLSVFLRCFCKTPKTSGLAVKFLLQRRFQLTQLTQIQASTV